MLSVDLYTQNEKKFKCPCHGSQYNREGKVVRGPAPLVSCDTIICSGLLCSECFALLQKAYTCILALLQLLIEYSPVVMAEVLMLFMQSLALAHCNITDDLVSFTPWTETDFRTGEKPWWS